jgi:hypothetical protein
MRARVVRILPVLVSIPLLAWVVFAASSPALGASPTRSCGRFKVEGHPVSNVRVTNVTCAEAKRLMVHFHDTDRGLRCFTFSEDAPVHIRCKQRVAVAGKGRGGSGRRFVVAVIDFGLPECAPAGECGT